jgi:catalase
MLVDEAVPRLVGQRLGLVTSYDDCPLDVEITLDTGPSVLYDAVVIPDGAGVVMALEQDAHAMEFLKLQYRHGKPMLAVGSGVELLAAAGIPFTLPSGEEDPGVIRVDAGDFEAGVAAFKEVLARHRIYARETNPPRV